MASGRPPKEIMVTFFLDQLLGDVCETAFALPPVISIVPSNSNQLGSEIRPSTDKAGIFANSGDS